MIRSPYVYLVSRHAVVTETLGRHVDALTSPQLPILCPARQRLTVSAIEELLSVLDERMSDEIMNAVVLVDLTAEVDRPWNVVVTRQHALRPVELILAYPEVYWIFLVDEHAAVDLRERFGAAFDLHFVCASSFAESFPALLRRHVYGFRAWFDPAGLRSRVLHNEERSAPLGVAIDEETAFALFNAYLLHRNGFSTYMVTTFHELETVGEVVDRSSLLLEDIELNFGDIPEKAFWTNALGRYWLSENGDEELRIGEVLRQRTVEFRLFSEAGRRIMVTSQVLSDDDCQAEPNIIGAVQKPYAGIYAMPPLSKIPPAAKSPNAVAPVPVDVVTALESDAGETETHASDRTASSSPAEAKAPDLLGSPHGAPFWAQTIAERLLQRTVRLEQTSSGLVSAIHLALLASVTREVLQQRNVTLSLQALALQHRMEVTAECAFMGTTGTLDVAARIRSLDAEVEVLFAPPYLPQMQKAKAMAEIVSQLRRIYETFGRIREEGECMREMRRYRRQARYYNRHPNSRLLRHRTEHTGRSVGRALEWYFDMIVGGFRRITAAMAAIVLLFTVLFALSASRIGFCADCSEGVLWGASFMQSAVTFFALQSGIVNDATTSLVVVSLDDTGAFFLFWTITVAEMLLGFMHLGLLVSYLYEKLSRR